MNSQLMVASRHDEIFDWAGLLVRDLVRAHHTTSAEVLDVGAGYGKYRILLHEYHDVDACEIWEPTAARADLWSLYRTVYVDDVCDLVELNWWRDAHYDVVILGDVLEHIYRDKAQVVLERLREHCDDVIVVVPYLYEQGEEDGNVHQRHLQSDLTPELMSIEYPALSLIAIETRDWRPFKGIYRWSVT